MPLPPVSLYGSVSQPGFPGIQGFRGHTQRVLPNIQNCVIIFFFFLIFHIMF
jgi:hypothetical protein